jgi:hypothetical protein
VLVLGVDTVKHACFEVEKKAVGEQPMETTISKLFTMVAIYFICMCLSFERESLF